MAEANGAAADAFPARTEWDAMTNPVQPLALEPVPALPVPAAAGAVLPQAADRVRGHVASVGMFAVVLGVLGAGLAAVTLLGFGQDLASGVEGILDSPSVREAMFFGVPALLMVYFVIVAAAGRRLLGSGVPPAAHRATLSRTRGLLVLGMLLTLLATVLGLLARNVGAMLTVGIVHLLAFVASARLATRVRDTLSEIDTVGPLAPPVLRPARVIPIDADEPWPARPPAAAVAAPHAGELDYASSRHDSTRDFLRLFDLLAVFGAVMYGLRVPGLLDRVLDRGPAALTQFTGVLAPGMMATYADVLGDLVIPAVAAIVAVGWAFWGTVYVAFGPVLYRLCFALAALGVAVAALQTGLFLMVWTQTFWSQQDARGLEWLAAATQGWLFPVVMLFSLTRPRVRQSFRERNRPGPVE
jgi:hypothetical protein